MKINQLKSIHSWVRSSSTSEVLFVTALVLPIYLLLYNAMINQISQDWKNWGLGLAVLLYFVGLFWMKLRQSKEEKNFTDLLIIKNHILDKGYRFMSFERIAEIDQRLDEKRVKQLVFAFPNELRFAKLKENKRGIKVLNLEVEQD
ncbi:hypothetical protein [Croceimicrobium sp.]|uniref:hypothetical protein n=1 Tax=Croceimicrobium sp. TaxID=2828340 RepID=UPI003BAA517F